MNLKKSQTQLFSVGDFKIDTNKSTISSAESTVSIEPKVMHVLLVLAKKQGKVVTHEELLHTVWHKLVVTPAALQRCIAQLRKIFQDKAKSPRYIATYPKKGYSLIKTVQWESEAQFENSHKSGKTYNNSRWFIVGFCSILLIISTIISINLYHSNDSLNFKHLSPITATDNREFLASFSPDGRYIAFQRYVNKCERQLWAKNLQNNQEHLLTQNTGYYGKPIWSPNGQSIMFTNINSCGLKKSCTELRSVSFPLAKVNPQPSYLVAACDSHNYSSFDWLDNHSYVAVVNSGNQSQIKKINIENGHSELIYQPKEVKPYHISYSLKNNQLVVMEHDSLQNVSMTLINTHSKSTTHQQLSIPEKYQNHIWWRPNWHPTGDHLIAGFEHSLFHISPKGEVKETPLFTIENISNPVYHPDGERIAATLGVRDIDWGILSKDTEGAIISEILDRSTQIDDSAQFQPSNNSIAFISNRSGNLQLWLYKDGHSYQLTHIPDSHSLDSYRWNAQGNLILISVSGQLHTLTLNGEMKELSTTFKVTSIYQALNSHQFLINATVDNHKSLLIYDLQSNTYETLFSGFNYWAQINQQGIIYLVDGSKQLHVLKDGTKTLFKPFSDMKTTSKFLIKGTFLHFLSTSKQLWSYDFSNKTKSLMYENLEIINELQDIQIENTQLLYSSLISNREEVVVLNK